jgi:uncharacterized membrane protein YbhN (UPF0104 family)
MSLIVCSIVSSVDASVAWTYVWSIYPVSIIAGLAPVTISGIGTRDAVMDALLGSRMEPSGATIAALGYTFFAYWVVAFISTPIVFSDLPRFLKNGGEA